MRRARWKRKNVQSRSVTFVPPRCTGDGVGGCLRVRDGLPTGAAGCRADLTADSCARVRLGSGCKAAFDLLLFPRVPLRYALPWAVAGLLRWPMMKRSSITRPAAAAYPLRVKEKKVNATTTPTTSAPSATGRQSQKPQKRIACPKVR